MGKKRFVGKNYPYDTVTPFSSIQEMLAIAAQEAGDKEAFLYREKGQEYAVTYRQFRDQTIALGTALSSIGLSEAHIACIGENSYRWLLSYLTVLGTQGVFVPIDRLIEDEAILNILIHSESRAIIFSGERYAQILRKNRDKLSAIEFFIDMDAQEDTEEFISLLQLLKKGEKLVADGDRTYLGLKSDENALKMLVYTSGTTGTPKGVMLSEHNLVSCVYYGLQVSTVFERCLSVLPYHHTYEAVAGILVGLHKHVTICINESLRTILPNLQRYKPAYIYIVPAIAEVFYKRIWDNVEKQGKTRLVKTMISVSNGLRTVGIDLRKKLFSSITKNFGGNLRKVVCGGAPLRAEIAEFFDAIGITMVNGYGISECSPLVSANRDRFNDPETVGMPLACIEVRVDNPDEEGIGELCVKGDIVMLGYFKEPEKTAEVLQDGWFYTGDYGMINDLGQILITGRKKNIIILPNGKNVYPEEIENEIMAIPYVKEVIVSAYDRTEDSIKQGLCAELFLDAEKLASMGVENPAAKIKEDIDALCATMPPYKQITKVVVRETEFEKTTSNKVKRKYK